MQPMSEISLAFATSALLEFGGRRRLWSSLPHEAAQSGAQTLISQQLGTVGNEPSLGLTAVSHWLSKRWVITADIALELVERRRDRVEFGRSRSLPN